MRSLILLLMASQAATPTFSPATPKNQKDWLTDDNYPTRALGLGQFGQTQIDVFVDPTGAPRACYVALSSGSKDLDGQGCAAVMHRGRFDPARDASAKPVNGVFRFRVVWRLPDERSGNTPADVTLAVSKLPGDRPRATVRLKYVVDEGGRIVDCGIDASSGYPSLDAAACRAMPTRFKFAPARDGNGKAWSVIRTQSVAFEIAR